MGTIKFIAGEYADKLGAITAEYKFITVSTGLFGSAKIDLKGAKVEKQTEQSVRNLGGMVGGAAIGTLLAGPVGLLLGGIFAGRRNEVCFSITTADGKFHLAVGKPEEYAKAIAATHENSATI